MAYQLFHLPKSTNIGTASFRLEAGAKAYFYEPGTTTPQDTYQDEDLQTPHAHPVVADASGVLPTIYLNPELQYKLTLTTSADVLIYTVDPVNDQVLSQAIIGQLLNPQTQAEEDAEVVPVNYAYAAGYADRFGMIADSGITDNTAALQNLINGSAGDVPVRIRKGDGYYKITGRITAPARTRIILEDGAELRWATTTATGTSFLGTATRPGIEVLGDNFAIEGKGVLRGPSVATYVQNEAAIFAKGANTAARLSGLRISDEIEIVDWGAFGVLTQFVDDIDIRSRGVHIHDVAYAGVSVLSGNGTRLSSFKVGSISGSGGLGYGITLTHDSTGYSADPDAGTKSAANPFCADFDVDAVTVYDVPVWTGIDVHGGYEGTIRNCKVYNCRIGIALAGSSGDASNYAGENNSVLSNLVTARRITGAATTISATDRYGIIVAGGSTVSHSNVTVEGNTTEGYGDSVVTSYSIHAARVRNAIIRGNRVLDWRGNAIYTSDGDGVISDNIFGAVNSATNSCCLFLDSTTGSWQVTGNKHRPVSGTAAAEGLRINHANNPRCTIADNDLDYATAPYANFDGTQTMGSSQITPQVTATGSPTSVDVSPAGRAPRVRVVFSTSGGSTVTDFTGAHIGQIIECSFPTTNVTVVDRTNAALAGGSNFSSTQYDTLVLECVNSSGIKFLERSRAANS